VITDRLPVRRVRFEYPDDLDPAWNRRFPEFAYGANSVSLLMPFAEPYFVKSVRAALPQLDESTRARTDDFLRQELEHSVQHRRFNLLMTRRYPRLVWLERRIRATYSWLGRTRSLRFNLAFAAGSETIAYAIARWSEDHLSEFFDDADPVAANLYLWHLAEEVEHKTVAFDVYETVDGSRFRYLRAMLTSFSLLALFSTIAVLTMMASDRRIWHPISWFRLLRWSVSLAFEILPDMFASAMPGHHPSDFTDPVWLRTSLRYFDPETATMPLWEGDPRRAA
jgi:uncharacterized protein